MQTIINLCRNGRPFQICKLDDPVMREFYKVREEWIITDDNILSQGTNVVIPESLRDETVALEHEGHQGNVNI